MIYILIGPYHNPKNSSLNNIAFHIFGQLGEVEEITYGIIALAIAFHSFRLGVFQRASNGMLGGKNYFLSINYLLGKLNIIGLLY